ncbi:MAG: Lrp/AsnC family transcriptional regulator [Duncaniella sp.]|nr:Lrp/AsnC family transcriptional regulator [Duncaniella sp.]
MTVERLDYIDLEILRALSNDARLSLRQLAAAIHRSPTPTFERLRRLEREGYIKKYVAVLDTMKLGGSLMVYCMVKLRAVSKEIAEEFESVVSGLDEVAECYNVSGSFDYLLKVYANSMTDYQQFLLNRLGTIKSVGSLASSFVMGEVKRELNTKI